jgi:hypothetical protein
MPKRQAKLIFPCGFEVLDLDKKEKQEKGINEAIAKGYMLIFIFNDDSSNVKNLIPTNFKENIEHHPMYFAWIDMLMQRYDSNHPKYGLFNIFIKKEWIKSFDKFVKDMKFSSEML